jgi:hypothetical protein
MWSEQEQRAKALALQQQDDQRVQQDMQVAAASLGY